VQVERILWIPSCLIYTAFTDQAKFVEKILKVDLRLGENLRVQVERIL